MIKVTNIPTVTCDDIERELGIRVYECEFAEMAENDSYVMLDLDNDHIEDIKADLDWNQGKCNEFLEKRLNNELTLINYFREQGYTDRILVFVSW